MKQLLLVIVILILGVMGFYGMTQLKTPPEKKEVQVIAPFVQTIVTKAIDKRVEVRGHGTVQAKVSIQVVPQVAGRVVKVSELLAVGEMIPADTVLFEVESTDYELSVRAAKAQLARAQVQYEQEQAEAAVAKSEWDRLNPGKSPPSSLLLREPQVNRAIAEVEAAKANLAMAELNLSRTKVSVPFDCCVRDESVGLGQYVTPGQPVASVYGTNVMEVMVPFEDRSLKWFKFQAADDEVAQTHVHADFAGRSLVWPGRAVRTSGQVDSSTRMVPVVIRVDDPVKEIDDQSRRLLPGMFVEVVIQGQVLPDVIPVPRYAVREGNVVWTHVDGRLKFRPVEVVHMDTVMAYIGSGLEPGVDLISSSLETVSDGMQVKVVSEE